MSAELNRDAVTVSAHFGHSMEVPMRHYIKPVDERVRRAALALDGKLAGWKESAGERK